MPQAHPGGGHRRSQAGIHRPGSAGARHAQRRHKHERTPRSPCDDKGWQTRVVTGNNGQPPDLREQTKRAQGSRIYLLGCGSRTGSSPHVALSLGRRQQRRRARVRRSHALQRAVAQPWGTHRPMGSGCSTRRVIRRRCGWGVVAEQIRSERPSCGHHQVTPAVTEPHVRRHRATRAVPACSSASTFGTKCSCPRRAGRYPGWGPRHPVNLPEGYHTAPRGQSPASSGPVCVEGCPRASARSGCARLTGWPLNGPS